MPRNWDNYNFWLRKKQASYKTASRYGRKMKKSRKKKTTKSRLRRLRDAPFKSPIYGGKNAPFIGARPSSLMKPKRYVKMIFPITVTFLTPTDGTCKIWNFNASSVYEPDPTTAESVGNQPYLFDQWKTFYQRYRVVRSRLNIQIDNHGAGSNHTYICGVRMKNAATGDPSVGAEHAREYMELPYTKFDTLAGTNVVPRRREFTMTYKWNEWFEKSDLPDLEAPVTQDPVQNVYFQIWAGQLINYSETTSDATSIGLIGTIEYTVELSDPVLQATSL